ncbi:MAG: cobalt transporter CbiM [Lachnospiraceae bacterium]|nr:cobalt transporter CbiM [Lachnospiraceae bacterium]
MHIPDNYLSPQTCGVMTAAMIPVWAISVKKIAKEMPKEDVPKMGVGAAFSFLGMMFNIPIPGGTTGHAVGGTLISSVLGPYAACLSVSVALLLQALIFGDGGILAFGANCFNMAFVLPFVGFFMFNLLKKGLKKYKNGDVIAAGIGSYFGLNAAALMAAIEFGIQPLLFTDASGNALYCPYGLSISIPAMMIGHLTIFGLAEIVYTSLVYGFIKQVSPATIDGSKKPKTSKAIIAFLGALIVLTPLGLLAEGTAWGEWGTDEIAATGIGYTPKGMLHGFSFDALIPDYSIEALPGWFAYIISAIIGVALAVILFRIASAMKKSREASA